MLLHSVLWMLWSRIIRVVAQNLSSLAVGHPQFIDPSVLVPLAQVRFCHPGMLLSLLYNQDIWIALSIVGISCGSSQLSHHWFFWHNCVCALWAIALPTVSKSPVIDHRALSRKYVWSLMVSQERAYRHACIRSSFSHQSLFVSLHGFVFNRQASFVPARFVRFVSLIFCIHSIACLVRLIASALFFVCSKSCELFCMTVKIPANPTASRLTVISISISVNPLFVFMFFFLVVSIEKIICRSVMLSR